VSPLTHETTAPIVCSWSFGGGNFLGRSALRSGCRDELREPQTNLRGRESFFFWWLLRRFFVNGVLISSEEEEEEQEEGEKNGTSAGGILQYL
jgi:hypothetical protein